MTAPDMLPLCFVEGSTFHKLKHYIEPECTKPTKSHNIRHYYLVAI